MVSYGLYHPGDYHGLRALSLELQCTFRRTLMVLYLKSLFWLLSSCYPCNWEPGRAVPGCRGGLHPGWLLFDCFWCETSSLLGPRWMFHLLTCTPIKRTCTALRVYFSLRQFTDWTMMVERQLQEKKGTGLVPSGAPPMGAPAFPPAEGVHSCPSALDANASTRALRSSRASRLARLAESARLQEL